MKEILSWNITIWNNYWDSGIYQYLLLAAILYLLIRRRNRTSTKQILPYIALVLLLFICPVSAAIIQKCIGADVYWRVLWLLPTAPVIALAGTELLSKRIPVLLSAASESPKSCTRKKLLYLALSALFLFIAVFCGRSLLRSGVYERTNNYQKVPDAVAHICNIVKEAADGDFVFLAADEHISTYVRVYDASICMPYGRRGQGALDWRSRRLYDAMNTGTFEEEDYIEVVTHAKAKRCNFIAVALTEHYDETIMTDAGYTQVGQVNQYGIFQLTP